MTAADELIGSKGNGQTRRLAVLGRPIGHSLSPRIHNAALAHLGMDGEWSYEAIEVGPDEFAERTRALPAAGFVGANVTIPHKRAALALADRSSDRASEIGAANTLSFSEGSVIADNTDAPGFLAALPTDPRGRAALVLGAGGSARAVVWALGGVGVSVSIWNRTAANADALAEELGATVIAPPGKLPIRDYDLIVNTTSVGLGGSSPEDLNDLRVAPEQLSDAQTVVDLVYGEAKTELLRVARCAGARTVDGREVLVRQGAESFRIWTGIEPPLEVMRRAAKQRA